MLSSEECYEIAPFLKDLPKEEALKVREILYEWGDLAVEDFIRNNASDSLF